MTDSGDSFDAEYSALCEDLDLMEVLGEQRLQAINEVMDRIKSFLALEGTDGLELAMAEVKALEERIARGEF